MKVWLNGVPRDVRATRLSEMLAEIGMADARVATAVNGDFVPASRREDRMLAEGDRVEVVAPQQGG